MRSASDRRALAWAILIFVGGALVISSFIVLGFWGGALLWALVTAFFGVALMCAWALVELLH